MLQCPQNSCSGAMSNSLNSSERSISSRSSMDRISSYSLTSLIGMVNARYLHWSNKLPFTYTLERPCSSLSVM
ncbi:MAG: hypothetical protein ACFFAS_00325 [Promethearchaeota archaeon]